MGRFFADGLMSHVFEIVTVAKNPDQQRSAFFCCFPRVHRRGIGEGLFTTVEGSTMLAPLVVSFAVPAIRRDKFEACGLRL